MEDLFPAYRWGKAFRADLLKAFLPELIDNIRMFEDSSLSHPFLTTIQSLYIIDHPYYYYRVGRPGSICSEWTIDENRKNFENVIEYFRTFRGGILSTGTTDCYYRNYYFQMIIDCIDRKMYRKAKELIGNQRFLSSLKEVSFLKRFLLKHKMCRTYRLLRHLKNG